MRTALLFFAATLLVAPGASAETPSYKSIPQTKLPAVPDRVAAPDRIAATEKVDGVFVARPPDEQRRRNLANQYKVVNVYGTDKEAKDFAATGRETRPDDPASRACIASGGSSSYSSRATVYVSVPTPAPKPVKNQQAQIGLVALGAGRSKPRNVTQVRVERFVPGQGGPPRLVITDAWVDADTGGARLIGKSEVPLGRVGTSAGPGGLEIYGARDDKNVLLVVRSTQRAPDKDLPPFMLAGATRLTAQTPAGTSSTADCGHLRMSLGVEPGGGQMATIFGNAMLPPVPDDDEAPIDSSKEDDDHDVVQPANAKMRDLRTRPFAAALSVSQTKSEKEPIVSVAFGWSGKDQHQRF